MATIHIGAKKNQNLAIELGENFTEDLGMPAEISSVSHGTSYSSLHPPNIYTPKIAVFEKELPFSKPSMGYHTFTNFSSIHLCRGICEAKTFQHEKHTNLLGVGPIPATVTTRITCLVGDSYKPSSLPGGNTQGPWDLAQEATGATKSWGPGMKTEIIFFGFGDCFKMLETYSAYHHKQSVNNHNHRTRNILNAEINSVFYWTRYSSNIYTPKIAVFEKEFPCQNRH